MDNPLVNKKVDECVLSVTTRIIFNHIIIESKFKYLTSQHIHYSNLINDVVHSTLTDRTAELKFNKIITKTNNNI